MASYGSSSRNGATVRLVVLHTAEGSRTKESLANFFDGNDGASSHVGIDNAGILDMIGRDRAAWTLGSGNPVSVNAEMCAFARWTRAQWLSQDTVDGCANPRQIVRNAAAWARRECDALGIPKRVLTVEQVRAGWAGICDHNAYNRAYNAGDHTDVGAGFPWDVFAADLNGTTSEDDMPLTANDGNTLWAARDPFGGKVETHPVAEWIGLSTFYGLYANQRLAKLEGVVTGLAELVKQAVADDRDIDMAAIEAAAEKGAREGTAGALKSLPVEVDINLAGDRDTTTGPTT